MLTCIACSKHGQESMGELEEEEEEGAPRSPAPLKALAAQLKDMAIKFSVGAYRHCKPCASPSSVARYREDRSYIDSVDITSDTSSNASSSYPYFPSSLPSTSQLFPPLGMGQKKHHPSWAYYMNQTERESPPEDGAPSRDAHEDEDIMDSCQWVAQVEPGVLITFLSLPDGTNRLKRIRFSRHMFDKWQAQQWWIENHERVYELYNVSRFIKQSGGLLNSRTECRSTAEMESRINKGKEMELSTGVLEGGDNDDDISINGHLGGDGGGSSLGPASSNEITAEYGIMGTCDSLPESRLAQSSRTTSSASLNSNLQAIEQEAEWVLEDEPGVYLTVRTKPVDGTRELKRVRFSREKFTEIEARFWWDENRVRITNQYL